jgi:dipeptidase E
VRRLLLFSNSRDSEGRYLHHGKRAIAEHLRAIRRVLFIPYADVMGAFDGYRARVQQAFDEMDVEVRSIHESSDVVRAINDAESIVVGGGNTFRLLSILQEQSLLDPLRERILTGIPYIGWSAGSVLASPTIKTTNDMPIVQPSSFDALGLVKFQINAHFTDAHPPGFQGETRRERICEFLIANPNMPVLGLPEGDWLRVEGAGISLNGVHRAVLFRRQGDALEIEPGSMIEGLVEN